MQELRAHTLLQNEVHNAQQVQQVLVPNDLEPLDNFAVEAVYLPAREVGGDFFQVIPCANGSLLVVIGDVSGKGIPAAMVVALTVGALRTAVGFTTSPAALLRMLNEQLHGRLTSGFATCLIVRVSPTGELEMANAAHLSPYLNGEEIALEPQVPLGISTSASYRTERRQLNPGDRLTFVSDGVVEARTEAGELFGFERTKEISQLPAREIVAAAKAHGQDDDITVLTVSFAAAAQPVLAMASRI
jgi:serine phosphatase RsbU (regulator of sigma subunit)